MGSLAGGPVGPVRSGVAASGDWTVVAMLGGALLTVEFVPDSDAKSREAIARELEFDLSQVLPALPWARVQVA